MDSGFMWTSKSFLSISTQGGLLHGEVCGLKAQACTLSVDFALS
ncbi:hypothetical protein PG5_34460 [Pseudomonas sp. G5(2012)]|jgi:hypothetical protein|nr:hypothetical protein PG5_34460 [Pseudomonas sp. G5(2012)]